jgi:BirA family biotin operon repressor/biotin-[acetyl-CoA-carboxylase] ligase
VPEAGSTNADLAAAARTGRAGPGTVLVTDFQSAGRGRQGRSWTAPPGTNVAMSVLLAPSVATPRWTWLPLLAGLGVAAGLHRAAGVPARLKWPNDVLVGEQKVCGILAERVETPNGPGCVLGMGINVHLEPADLPVPTATSLAILAAAAHRSAPSRSEVIIAVLTALDDLLSSWTAAADDSALAEAYAEQSDTLGRRVRVMVSDGSTVEGDAESIDADGRLRVRTPSGLSAFSAGDVIHLRT